MKIFDLHNDYLTELKKDKKCEKFVFKQSKIVTGLCSAVWTSKLSSVEAMKKIEQSYNFISKNNDKIDENYSLELKLCVEDLHFISKQNLNKLINFSPAYCSLTWNDDNCLAGGAIEGGDLTPLGEDVVKELEENNIFVDTAHLSEKSFMSFSSITSLPILCSHTCVNSLTNHMRNLKDYQIKMIVESGGLIGIAFVTQFLTSEKTSQVKDVARHIDYIVSRFGDDNICLGTDFYGTKNTPKGLKTYSSLDQLKSRLEFLGYSENTIDKIFYLNAENFFSRQNSSL